MRHSITHQDFLELSCYGYIFHKRGGLVSAIGRTCPGGTRRYHGCRSVGLHPRIVGVLRCKVCKVPVFVSKQVSNPPNRRCTTCLETSCVLPQNRVVLG